MFVHVQQDILVQIVQQVQHVVETLVLTEEHVRINHRFQSVITVHVQQIITV